MRVSLRRPRSWRRLAVKGAGALVACALFAGLAAGLQVRRVDVTGTRRFPAVQVERALESALGRPTVSVRAETLRDAVLALGWVADATVRIGFDGTVHCTVVERAPVAVAVDGARSMLLDADGRVLAAADGATVGPELHGFAAYPEQRRRVLRAMPTLERAWQAPVVEVDRLGPGDAAVRFANFDGIVVVDPARPDAVAEGRRVLQAWTRRQGLPPARIDVRARSWVMLRPAEVPPAGEEAS